MDDGSRGGSSQICWGGGGGGGGGACWASVVQNVMSKGATIVID
jgi:hypothetical protein